MTTKTLYRLLVLFALPYITFVEALSQQDIKQIILPSPTVAALAKYGDIPVSYYTGTPSISVPLYQINTGDFQLPISLSYHASGVKVEEMASWVGLGWSLNAGGIISRSVRGKPDEPNGYMDPGTDMKVLEILQMPTEELDDFFQTLVQTTNSVDMEPDLFHFNFGGHSGKFHFNQESGNFVAIPQKPLLFDKNHLMANGKWRIVAEDGTEYQFDNKEQNANYTACGGIAGPGGNFITGWFLTKIITPVSKKEILFTYEPTSYSIKNMNSQTILLSPFGLTECSTNAGIPQLCESYSDYLGFRLTSITFDEGHIEFVAATNRIDQLGDKRLDTVKVFRNGTAEPIKQFALGYGHFNEGLIGSGYNAEQLSVLVRLKLESVTEVGRDGSTLPPYVFDYNEEVSLPSRLSYAQDHWGFYNGRSTNEHLVPPIIIQPGNLFYDGADRETDEDFTTAGVLSKVTYPTGGNTSFTFENHTIKGVVPYSVNDNTVFHSVVLDATAPCDPPVSGVFCKSVVIDNQQFIEDSDPYNDGVFITISVHEIFNCEHCPTATSCAVLSLAKEGYGLPITCDVENLFVPNGNYELKADFSAGSANYNDFAIAVSWLQVEVSPSEQVESKVGGVRIRQITDNDGLGKSKSTYFSYLEDDGIYSSGKLVTSFPVYEYDRPCTPSVNSEHVAGYYITRDSYSNLPLGTTQGSHIGYGRIAVSNDEAGGQGFTVYHFSDPEFFGDVMDFMLSGAPYVPAIHYPFAPAISADHRRGLLLKQEEYRSSGGTPQLIKVIENTYSPLGSFITNANNFPLHDRTYGIKLSRWEGNPNANPAQLLAALYTCATYVSISEWVKLDATVETTYEAGIAHTKTRSHQYDNTGHMQPTTSKTVMSDGSELSTHLKYPLDYVISQPMASLTDPATKGIKNLQEDHIITSVVEQFSTLKRNGNEAVTAGALTKFNFDIPVPAEGYGREAEPEPFSSFSQSTVNGAGQFSMDADLRRRVLMTSYDDLGNLLEQRKEDDSYIGYIWGYNRKYPIAEVINARRKDMHHTSFEEDGTVGNSKTGRKYFAGGVYNAGLQNLTNGEYTLSYWKLVSGSWEFFNSSVMISTGSYIFNISGDLDEVRFYPANARMTTYTFEPMVGMTSACDVNNNVMYYEYDSFGRLKTVKDDKHNVVKAYNYRYRGQQGQE
jgi:hypothetical protein